MKKILFSLIAFAVTTQLTAQTKIGGTPGAANVNAYLELDASGTPKKGLLHSRVALTATTNAAPLTAHVEGMMVYNTATTDDVTPGIYYNDGTKWVRAGELNQFNNILYGSGAPTGSCASGTLYTDTLQPSPTRGQQWTCSGGSWVSYTAPQETAWYLTGTTNDAGGTKGADIYRYGAVETHRYFGFPSTARMLWYPAGRQLVLTTSSTSWANSLRLGGPTSTWYAGGTPSLVLDSATGAVGIRTLTSGTAGLDVAGNVNIITGAPYGGNAYTFNGGAGGSLLWYAGGSQIVLARDAAWSNSIRMGTNTMLQYVGGLIAFNATNTGVGIFTPASYTFHVNGTAAATAFATLSDQRFKKNIKSLSTNALTQIMALQPKSYHYKSDAEIKAMKGITAKDSVAWNQKINLPEGEQFGFIAQEVEKIIPQIVETGSDGYKAVDYGHLTPILVKAIQDQQAQIEILKKEIAALKAVK